MFERIIAQLITFPIGEGISLSKYVNEAVKALIDAGVKVIPDAMLTVIVAETLEEIFKVAKLAQGKKSLKLW
ncbi:MAG: thiamine-binding protein [Candidatus Lokiarchaeia archaeon]